jgi:cytochrome c-type biogenesis protein CcmE
MELTPRAVDHPPPGSSDDDDPAELAEASGELPPLRPRGARRRWIALAGIGVVIVALGFVVIKGLGEATVYFRNADEAVRERDELGDRRFRLQGTVVDDAVTTERGVTFDVTFNDVDVVVHHAGDPPEMFRPGQSVVLEGHWDASGDFFDSDRMLIRHDATYESQDDYDERMREAEAGGDGAAGHDEAGGDGAAGHDEAGGDGATSGDEGGS